MGTEQAVAVPVQGQRLGRELEPVTSLLDPPDLGLCMWLGAALFVVLYIFTPC